MSAAMTREHSAAAALAPYADTVGSSPMPAAFPPPLVSRKYAPLDTANPIRSSAPTVVSWARSSLSGTGVMCWKKRPPYCSAGGKYTENRVSVPTIEACT